MAAHSMMEDVIIDAGRSPSARASITTTATVPATVNTADFVTTITTATTTTTTPTTIAAEYHRRRSRKRWKIGGVQGVV